MIVVVATNAERIEGLIKATTILEENVATLQRNLDQIKGALEKVGDRIHELDKGLTRLDQSLRHSDEKLENLRLSRYEFGKLLLAALLGGGITFGVTQLNEWLKTARAERQVQTTRP